MAVNEKQKRFLKGQLHPIKPVVMIGNSGLTPAVLIEIDKALIHHELIKVRVSGQERADRKQMLEKIVEETGAELIQVIGHIGGFYRPAEVPKIALPK